MHQVFRQWMLITGIGLGLSQPAAAKFYTIIGPDGFPMVVYNQEDKAAPTDKKKQDAQAKAQIAAEKQKQTQRSSQLEKQNSQAQVTAPQTSQTSQTSQTEAIQPSAQKQSSEKQPAQKQATQDQYPVQQKSVQQTREQQQAVNDPSYKQSAVRQAAERQQLEGQQLESRQLESQKQAQQRLEKKQLESQQQAQQQLESRQLEGQQQAQQQLEKQQPEKRLGERQQVEAKEKARTALAQKPQINTAATSAITPSTQQAVRLPAADPTQRVSVEALFPKTPAREKIGIQDQTPESEIQQQVKTEDPHYTVIDGVEYISHEYLEDREFNLEGKKRFYVMPEFGNANAHRMQTVERERGITSSILGGRSRKPQVSSSTLALSADYFRIEKADVEAALQQQCFEGEKLTKAKSLSMANKEIGFWPVAPLKERFVYEVAKLAAEVDTLQLQSYASRSKDEQFYWPMVVFLDQSGCVLEGVSGFKTENIAATAFRHASIQGLLKKPPQAVYFFMTPLSSAIDVEEAQLSHQGQVQLRMLD